MWAPVRGARSYRLCAHSLVRQSEAAQVGIRRSTVPPRHGCSAPRLHMRARRKLRVGWQKGRGQRRYHRYHKDIMSMMSKPSLRHHTKYDINVIFYEIMHPADLTFEMGFCLGDVAASRIRESLCSGCAERDDTARYPRTEQLPPRHREISPRSRTN